MDKHFYYDLKRFSEIMPEVIAITDKNLFNIKELINNHWILMYGLWEENQDGKFKELYDESKDFLYKLEDLIDNIDSQIEKINNK